MKILFSSLLSVLVIFLVNGHVVNDINNRSDIESTIYNNTEASVDSNRTGDLVTNVTTTMTTTTATPELLEENRIFRLRERFHYRNRRFRLRRVREQILQSLGWTVPPKVPESVRRRMLNNSFPMLPMEPEIRDRRCFSASCLLPRQIDRHLWDDEDLGGFRVYTNIPSRQELGRSTLESASLNVFLTHIEGFTCHGEVVPVSRTGSRFLVSVYQFIRPLRFQRSRSRVLNRKRLIDARMVTTISHTWVTFDVKQAVLEWGSGGRNNFGFEITVRDENETECNAVNMFVGADCQSPPETGCREDNTVYVNSLPWLGDIEGNYPYLELVSRPRRPMHASRRRLRRSSRSRSSGDHDVTKSSTTKLSFHGNDDVKSSLTEHGDVRSSLTRTALSRTSYLSNDNSNGDTTMGMCRGREMKVRLEPYGYVITPRHFTTLLCSGTCSTINNNTQKISRCHSTKERRIKGLYFDKNNNIAYGNLPFTQVLQCGC